MKCAVRAVCVLVLASLLFGTSTAGAEDAYEKILKDSLYGSVFGGLLGAACMTLTDKPFDHWGYIGTGAGVGLMLGMTLGFGSSMFTKRAAAEIDNKGVNFALPTISPDLDASSPTRLASITWRMDIVKGTFD